MNGRSSPPSLWDFRSQKAKRCLASKAQQRAWLKLFEDPEHHVPLAHDLKEAGVAVALLHPGFVRTEMTRGQGLIDPPESAAGLMARIDELTLQNSGSFWHMNGEILPW